MQVFISVTVCLAIIGTAESAGLFSFFPGLREKINEAKVSNCVGRRCQFNVKNFKLVDGSLKLSVKEKGRQIMCQRKLTQRKNNWYGSCDGDARDANFVKRTDPQGIERIYGSVTVGDEICHIAPNAQGEEEVTCRSTSEFKDDKPPVQITRALRERNLQANEEDYVVGFSVSVDSTSLRGRSHHGRQLDDSGATIDIMVLWTKDAECANSNLPVGCTLTNLTETNMRGRVQLGIAETNTAFELSGVNTQMRLVHAYRDPDYAEPTTGIPAGWTSQDLTLDRLSGKTDGHLDSVHAKRALYGADMVHIMVAGPGFCGLAYGGPDINFSFSLTHYTCATGYFSMGHELTHTLSGNHDRGSEGKCAETSTYNYAYRDPNAEFRTILALECSVNQCDKPSKNSCPRIQRFSNTKTLYNGKALGTPAHDNARLINEQRAKVASFFPAMNCKRDADCNDKNSRTIDTCNLSNGACVFTPTDGNASTNLPPGTTPTPAPVIALGGGDGNDVIFTRRPAVPTATVVTPPVPSPPVAVPVAPPTKPAKRRPLLIRLFRMLLGKD